MAWLGTSLKIVGQIWGLNFGKEGGWTPDQSLLDVYAFIPDAVKFIIMKYLFPL